MYAFDPVVICGVVFLITVSAAVTRLGDYMVFGPHTQGPSKQL